jgi:hypothetical protein
MDKERSQPRYLCSDLVELRTEAAKAVVLLENISASGACVQCEVKVPEGSRACLVCRNRQFRGSVRYCVRDGDAYFVGIVFDDDSKWSKAKYKPKHLLDPREVKPRRNGGKRFVN